MATILPVINNGNDNLVETLQQEVDEGIVRENQTLEMIEEQSSILESISESINRLFNPLESIVNLLKEDMKLEKNMAQEADDLRDRERVQRDIEEERGRDFDDSGSVRGTDGLFGDVDLSGGLIGNIIGLALTSWLFDLDDAVRTASAVFTKTFMNLLNGIYATIKMPFVAIKSMLGSIPVVKELPGIVRSVFTTMQTFATGLVASGSKVAKVGQFLKSAVTSIINPFNVFTNIFSSVARTFGFLARGLGFLRPLLGPFTLVVFGFIDFIKGFIGGLREGGLMEGFKSGFSELVSNLFGLPLDLLKDIISWVADKLGFENFSDRLDEFSITDFIEEWFEKIWDMITGVFGTVGKKISNFIFGDDEDSKEKKEAVSAFSKMGARGDTNIDNRVDRSIRTENALTPTGKAVGTGSNDLAAQRDKGRTGPAAVIAAPQTDNSSVNVQNNKTQFINRPGPRSSDHTFRSYQRARSGQ